MPITMKRSKSSKKKKEELNDNSVFGNIVKKAGLNFKQGKQSHELRVGQLFFQKNVAEYLEKSENYPEVTDEFLEAFQHHINDPVRLIMCLTPTQTALECDASALVGQQECLVRLLLGVDCIQSKLMNLLLEKLMEVADNMPAEFGQKVNAPQLILNQFRWLNYVVDSKACIDKMFDMISVTPVDVQKALVECIPEIVVDDIHEETAQKLAELMVSDNLLTVPILDALTNLNLKDDLLSEVRSSVINNMASMELDDLPATVKFLLKSITAKDAFEVIKDLRGKLDFSTSVSVDRNTQSKNSCTSNSNRGCEALTFSAIKMEVLFTKNVADAWIKCIQDARTAADHCVVDVFVLLILYNAPFFKRKNAVESLFRNKIRAGQFTENLLQKAFKSYKQILRESFNPILALAEVLLRSPEPGICYFSMAMYKQAMINFDAACQQEVIANLVTHIGSGIDCEIDSALDIFAFLAENHFKKLCPFAIFIKGVLDHLDNLSMGQIRKLYSTLSILGFSSDDGALIQDDMHIIMRKQLSHNIPKYKKMGVIGAIMIVKCLGRHRFGKLPVDAYQQVVSILKLVISCCVKTPESLCLFMDELSNLIQRNQLHEQVENWINENVTRDFEDDYIVDYVPGQDLGTKVVPMEVMYSLDDDSDGGIALRIVPLVVESMNAKSDSSAKGSKSMSMQCLAPQYRLLQVCVSKAHEGDMEEINATLGCPLILPAEHLYDKLESLNQNEKEIICRSLFFAHNWFIETVNAFAEENVPEVKAKCISRLENVTTVRKLLQKVLAVTPNFRPHLACYDICEDNPPPSAVNKSKKPRGRKRKLDEKEKENCTQSPDDTTQMDKSTAKSQAADKTIDTQETQQKKDKLSISSSLVDLNLYRKYFREIDMCVFKILRCGSISKSSLDTELNVKETTRLSVQPAELEYLLIDLTRKLEHSLIASECKRRCFFKIKSDKNVGFSLLDLNSSQRVAELSVKLLPTLCDHLEAVAAFFQTMMAENDGVRDGPGSNSDDAMQMGNSLCLLLQAITTILTWNGFLMTDNATLLKDALNAFSSRTTSEDISQLPLQAMVNSSFKYILGFSSSVPTLITAVMTCKLLVVISQKSSNNQLLSQLSELAKSYLQQEWIGHNGEKEKGARCNENLQVLLKFYLSHSKDRLASLEDVAIVAMPELLEAERNGYSATYPTLNRSSYPVFYRTMLFELIDAMKEIGVMKSSDSIKTKMLFVVKWNLAVRIFQVLVNLIKAFEGRTNLNSILKSGRIFIEVFMRRAMPLLDSVFRHHREDILSLLKHLQTSTRVLQHICGHSKIMKDITLTNHVPTMKKCLESFVFRVKKMLTLNKCHEAFWLGTLKNRDLKGEEILSQADAAPDSSQDNTGDDIPEALLEEDSESEVEMEIEDEKKKSGSESDESYSEKY